MLKIVAIKHNTLSNSRKSSIQTLHTNLKCSTTQSTFKNISTGLTRHVNETKNEEKDSNSSNTSLFTSALFSLAHASNTPLWAGGNPRDNFWACSGRVTRGFVLLHRKCMVFYIASERIFLEDSIIQISNSQPLP